LGRLEKRNQGQATDTGFSGMDYDTQSPSLNTAGGITNPSYQRKESPLIKNLYFQKDMYHQDRVKL
jgi:hypothetical protein